MIFHILEYCKLQPALITGAGLIDLQKTGEIGNAKFGTGEFLLIEADESDGSIVKYKPEIGILLNIDKDHKEIEELLDLFTEFRKNTQGAFIVNQTHERSRDLSENLLFDFGFETRCGFCCTDFQQSNFSISFKINGIEFLLPQIGRHNAENAAAAVAAAYQCGISIQKSAEALRSYSGIYRRHQIIGKHNGIVVIDDYAHNPAKIAASIKACQFDGIPLKCWFQPHGFKPTKFLRNDFVVEIQNALRSDDEIYMSEIYYAGGTATKDISAADLVNDLKNRGIKAFFVANRENLASEMSHTILTPSVVLLCGARDPSLADFASSFLEEIKKSAHNLPINS
jgi:UDP-N-acetylmuramate--alanine ligase